MFGNKHIDQQVQTAKYIHSDTNMYTETVEIDNVASRAGKK